MLNIMSVAENLKYKYTQALKNSQGPPCTQILIDYSEMITGGREKGALVSTSEGIVGASGTSTTCPGDAAPSLGSPEPWRGWF